MLKVSQGHQSTPIFGMGKFGFKKLETSLYRMVPWVREALAPPAPPSSLPRKCCVFVSCKCCLKSQQTMYLSIILRKCGQLLGASPQTPIRALALDPAGGLPSFISPHCPPLERILRVPMYGAKHISIS